MFHKTNTNKHTSRNAYSKYNTIADIISTVCHKKLAAKNQTRNSCTRNVRLIIHARGDKKICQLLFFTVLAHQTITVHCAHAKHAGI